MPSDSIVPVVLFIYKRPDFVKRIVDVLLLHHQGTVVIISDGAKSESELGEVTASRREAERLKKRFNVIKHYSHINLGCKQRFFTGLDFVFNLFEQAIILEDDCLPHPDFFDFANESLALFKEDTDIFLISGTNFTPQENSQYKNGFSSLINIWGWATWKNRWTNINRYIGTNDLVRIVHKNPLLDWKRRLFWAEVFKHAIVKSTIWDFYVQMHFFEHRLLSVYPTQNLIENIGFDSRATHTYGATPTYVLESKPNSRSTIKGKGYTFDKSPNLERDKIIEKTIWNRSLLRTIRMKLMNCIRLFFT